MSNIRGKGRRTLAPLAACISMIPALAWAQAAPAEPGAAQQLQRVEVTGSAIKRTDSEGPVPVEIIGRKEIQRTGATSVNELMRSITTFDIFDQGEVSSNSPSGSGTANFAMRGLASTNTLVLLNGRRLPVNALYDSSGAGASFDVNLIPVSAIDRIEILKDGGSAIYGADAVAGVVNIITRTDYRGMEATVGYGTSSRNDGTEKRATVTGGFGDLQTDRFNVFGAVDVFKRKPILRKDRELTRSVNGLRLGGTDGRSGFAPTGNVVDPNSGGFVGVPYRTCPEGALDPNNICRYDFNESILTSYNGADRLSGLAIATWAITPDIRVVGEVTAARTRDLFESHPAPDYFLMPITDPSQAPYDAGDGTVYIAGRFLQAGPRTTHRESRLLNTVLAVEGTSFGLDWKASVGRGVSRVTNRDSNYLNADLFEQAALDGSIDPTVTTNDPAVVNALKVTPNREGKATETSVNLQVGGDAFQLPAGPLRYAVGLSWWRETLSDRPDALTQQGLVFGSIQQSTVDAARNAKAAYFELAVPVLSNLEAQLAARYDKYPGYSQTSPKVALKYQPIPQLALRASYTQSFKAPVLKQLYGALEEGAGTTTDPESCTLLGVPLQPDGSCLVNIYLVNGSNPDLQPERGRTWNVGVVFEPSRWFGGSVDWWQIKKRDAILAPTPESAIEQGFVGRDGARILVFTNLQNFAQSDNSGVDVDLRGRIPAGSLGVVTLRDSVTYYIKQATRETSADSWGDFNGTYALPRWRNAFSVGLDGGAWSATAVLRSVGGFRDTDEPYPVPSDTRRVASHHELDLQGQYTVKGVGLTLGVRNVFDRMPPFSNLNLTNNRYSQEGYAELYNARGRFWYASVNYKFF